VKTPKVSHVKKGRKRKSTVFLTSQQWDEIEQRYSNSDQSIAEMAREFGIPRQRIGRYAMQRGWVRTATRRRLEEAKRGEVQEHVLLASRLVQVFERQIKKTEEYLDRVQEDEPSLSVSERERDARTLASLTRTLKQLEELRRLPEVAAKDKSGVKDQDVHGDDMRAELQRRLDQLAEADNKKEVST